MEAKGSQGAAGWLQPLEELIGTEDPLIKLLPAPGVASTEQPVIDRPGAGVVSQVTQRGPYKPKA